MQLTPEAERNNDAQQHVACLSLREPTYQVFCECTLPDTRALAHSRQLVFKAHFILLLVARDLNGRLLGTLNVR